MKMMIKLLTGVLVLSAGLFAVDSQAGQEPGRMEIPPVTALHLSPADTLEWYKPRFPERKDERHRLVREGVRQWGVNDEKVLDAMRHVPRHLFVPKSQQKNAYLNTPLPIGYGQTISQPYIVAYMTQLLEIEAGDKVLEIGTGSGYQAAVLSELTPYVFTIEIIEGLGEQARSRFEQLGYKTIRTKIGDGYQGWAEHAPYDAVILTAAANKIPEPLLEQLRAGGKLVMPKGNPRETQTLIRVTKSADGSIQTEQITSVRFVPMTGEIEQ